MISFRPFMAVFISYSLSPPSYIHTVEFLPLLSLKILHVLMKCLSDLGYGVNCEGRVSRKLFFLHVISRSVDFFHNKCIQGCGSFSKRSSERHYPRVGVHVFFCSS